MTKQQARLLQFLKTYSDANDGVMPSFAEIADHLGLRSKANVSRLIHSLQDRGLIRVIPNRARAIEIVSVNPVLDAYCRKTRAVPEQIIAAALAEYFARRRFPEGP